MERAVVFALCEKYVWYEVVCAVCMGSVQCVVNWRIVEKWSGVVKCKCRLQ
jgi:hypothetical protein